LSICILQVPLSSPAVGEIDTPSQAGDLRGLLRAALFFLLVGGVMMNCLPTVGTDNANLVVRTGDGQNMTWYKISETEMVRDVAGENAQIISSDRFSQEQSKENGSHKVQRKSSTKENPFN
jgi:hypothetical protein